MTVNDLIEMLQAHDRGESEVAFREGSGGSLREIGATATVRIEEDRVVIIVPLPEDEQNHTGSSDET